MKILIFLILFSNLLFAQDNPVFEKNLEVDEVNFNFNPQLEISNEILNSIIYTKSGELFKLDELSLDILRLEKFMFDNGYFNSNVDTAFTFNSDTTEINVLFNIKEGRSFILSDINYFGLDDLDQNIKNLVFSSNNISTGQIYNKNNINLEAIRILGHLQNNGYAFAENNDIVVDRTFSTNREISQDVKLSMYFKTGNKYYFGNTDIVIVDNKYGITISDISRNLEYKEGDLYQKDVLTKSENKISSIALIESSTFEIENIDSSANKINYKVTIRLKNKYQLVPEIVGYELSQRFYGGVGLSYTDRYFFGGGRTFNGSIRVLANSIERNLADMQLTVTQPFLFNNENITGSVRLGSTYLNDITNDLNYRVFEARLINGVAINLPTFTYLNNLTIDWELINQNILFKPESPFFVNNNVPQELIDEFDFNIFSSRFNISTYHNGTDNILYPTSGFFQSFNFQESGLIGGLIEKIFNTYTFRYLKFVVVNKYFMNLTNDPIVSVLGTKFTTGILYEYGDNTIVTSSGGEITSDALPTDFKFVEGGASSNRGWKAKQLGIVPDKSLGGNFIVDGSFEHRLRPFNNSKNFILKDLGFVSFVDYGNVWENASDFRFDELAVSFGAGIRYYTVIGAVRLDLGFKLYDPQPGLIGGSKWIWGSGANFNDKYNIQFGIGNTF
ncbi:MAG TPA: BamA/TamA family outer membrane protein [Ignavibacteria bacterium]|nr:BamA/TamA family outer membrane protein [Ignavibacteria bacterium]